VQKDTENDGNDSEEINCNYNNTSVSNKNMGRGYLKQNKNKQNFFYNYKNFIEFNKAENKNKLVVYNVHFPWKPIFDFEKCLILNKIADDIINRNQRNYIIIGDFNSKPNSLLMRMLYIENFISEIKYFKNIINFKTEYFRIRNLNENNDNKKDNFMFCENKEESREKNSKRNKYSYVNTVQSESLIKKEHRKSHEKIDSNVNHLISDFDILKKIKELKNNKNNNINNKRIDDKEKKLGKNNLKTSDDIKFNDNNENFWNKLSDQKNLENQTNKKIEEFDILKELFFLNIRIEKEKHIYAFDIKDKMILREILKLLSLSDNKKTFEDIFSTKNFDIKTLSNQYNYNQYNNNLNSELNYNHLYYYNLNNFNYAETFNNNQIFKNFPNNYNYNFQVNNTLFNAFSYNKPILKSHQDNSSSKTNNLGISISNENYTKIRNMIDNFKNLFKRYKFKSAYENYQVLYKNNLKILYVLKQAENLENLNTKNLICYIKDKTKNCFSEEDSKLVKDIDGVSIIESNKKNCEDEEIKKEKNSKHISDYFINHPLYTNFTNNFKDTIDYIFYSKYLIVDKILKLPDYDELASEGFLPSSKHPSDHLPLYAEFSIN